MKGGYGVGPTQDPTQQIIRIEEESQTPLTHATGVGDASALPLLPAESQAHAAELDLLHATKAVLSESRRQLQTHHQGKRGASADEGARGGGRSRGGLDVT